MSVAWAAVRAVAAAERRTGLRAIPILVLTPLLIWAVLLFAEV